MTEPRKPPRFILKPPYELYRDCDIADQNGHILTAESQEIAQALLMILRKAGGVSVD